MSARHCRECGAFCGSSGLCGRCHELKEERERAARLEAEIATTRKYRVWVPTFYWKDEKTWPEAVELAKQVAQSCVPYSVEIRDERGTIVRSLKVENGKVIEVQV